MNTTEKLNKMIQMLCEERGEPVPALTDDQKPNYFRALCNVRPPMPVTETFLRLQNEYLTARTIERGIVDVEDFNYKDNVALWRGDITRLNADAIVNACNAQLLGCFHPLHNCIDNVIHTNAGIQVRLDCYALTRGREEANGKVQVTFKNCYLSCLNKADEMNLKTIAFCCISTGEYRYPKKDACHLAVNTVREWKMATGSPLKIIFNVFLNEDEKYYERELGTENK